MCIKKWIAVLSALCVAVSLIAGCAHLTKESRNKQDNRPTIIVGSDIFPPYNYTDEHGNPAGIDVKIAEEAFGQLGYRTVFRQIDWEKKMSWSSQEDRLYLGLLFDGRKDAGLPMGRTLYGQSSGSGGGCEEFYLSFE